MSRNPCPPLHHPLLWPKKSFNKTRKHSGRTTQIHTFVKENHNLLKGFHEMDVVVAVFLNLLQEDQLWLALGAEHSQEWSVLLEEERGGRPFTFVGGIGLMPLEAQQSPGDVLRKLPLWGLSYYNIVSNQNEFSIPAPYRISLIEPVKRDQIGTPGSVKSQRLCYVFV